MMKNASLEIRVNGVMYKLIQFNSVWTIYSGKSRSGYKSVLGEFNSLDNALNHIYKLKGDSNEVRGLYN